MVTVGMVFMATRDSHTKAILSLCACILRIALDFYSLSQLKRLVSCYGAIKHNEEME